MRYILELYYSKINFVDFTNSSFFTLCEFAKSKELSAYQVSNILKSTKYKADYKNVYKKIRRFLNSDLIKKTKTIDKKHNSKFYRLTSFGIFSIFYHLHGKLNIVGSEIFDIKNGILTNYGNDDFFNFFIYPFFAKNTIMNIKSDIVLELFINYCSDCAHKSVSILYEQKLIDEHYKLASKDRISTWLSDIKDQLKNDPTDNVSLLNKEQLKNHFDDIIDKILFELGFDKVAILENTVIFPIISRGKYKTRDIPEIEHSPWYERNWKSVEKDIILLVKDSNFYKMLETTKNGYDACYKNIMECRTS